MNKLKSTKISAVFLATVLVAEIALSSPSFMTDAQAESEYGMNSYETQYGKDNNSYKSKDSSSFILKNINCNDINSNNNGVDVIGVPNNDALVEAQAEDEGKATTTNDFGYCEKNNNGYEQDNKGLKFVCINNNDNENNVIVINETILEPTITCEECFTESLTVIELERFLDEAFTLTATIEQACIVIGSGLVTEEILRETLEIALSEQEERIDDIIECLIEAGIEFSPEENGLNAPGGGLNVQGGIFNVL